MMPFIPIVRVANVDEAIAKAKHYEHGFRHTAIIHTTNVRNMTKMGRAMDTTLFVKNGPSMASLGLGGEGYLSFSIATPTGEGVTTPLTFTRERRCSLIDDLHILGKVTVRWSVGQLTVATIARPTATDRLRTTTCKPPSHRHGHRHGATSVARRRASCWWCSR